MNMLIKEDRHIMVRLHWFSVSDTMLSMKWSDSLGITLRWISWLLTDIRWFTCKLPCSFCIDVRQILTHHCQMWWNVAAPLRPWNKMAEYGVFLLQRRRPVQSHLQVRWQCSGTPRDIFLWIFWNTVNMCMQNNTLLHIKSCVEPSMRSNHTSNMSSATWQCTPTCCSKHCWHNWELLPHPSYSSDYHLLGCLKDALHGTHYSNDNNIKSAVRSWLRSVQTKFYHDGISKLVGCWQKCMAVAGDFIE